MSKLSALGLASVYDLLTGFAHRDDFWDLFERAFGTQYDSSVAEGFRLQWLAGDFGQFPKVEVVSEPVLGTANGAYAASKNTIYLSDQFVATASSQSLIAVLLEEYGHFVDAQVNLVDTPGDEGEIFALLVEEGGLGGVDLRRIEGEDDRGWAFLDGEWVAVEQSDPIVLVVNTTVDENDGSATIGTGLSLRDAVSIANKSPNTAYVIKLKSGTTYALTYVNNTTTGDRSLTTRGKITIEADGTELASIVNNGSPIPNQPFNWIIDNNSPSSELILNSLYISNKAGGGIYNEGGTATLTNNTITGNTSIYSVGGDFYNGLGAATLTNNTITGSNGGGIYNRVGTATLTNNTITGNNWSGIYNGLGTATLTLTNNIITGNTSTNGGGGITNFGTATLMNNTITGNTSSFSNGGGILNGGTATLTNNTITGNTSTYGAGGGIYNEWGTVTLTNNTISGNTSTNGGGIYNGLGTATLTLTNNTITGNTSTNGGGGGITNFGTATLTNNTITGNTSSVYGGGISNGLGTATLTNNTITGNTSTYGGGIYNVAGGTATLTNNAITGNTSTYGGGIYNGPGGTATLMNDTITGNASSNEGGGIYNIGTWNSNSLISGNTANKSWYIDSNGKLTTNALRGYDYTTGRYIYNDLHPTYPDIYDIGTFTSLPPSTDPQTPKPTISISNGRVVVPAGTNQPKILTFDVNLSSASDKVVVVDYYTLDGNTSSSNSDRLKDFQKASKQTLVFFPGEELKKQIKIPVFGSPTITDNTLEIFAKDTAFRNNWKDTDEGKEVDKIYEYSDLGYKGYRLNKVFRNGDTGFDAVGLTSDEKFFLVLANPINANEFAFSSNNLLQEIAITSGGNNTVEYTDGQNLINQLTSANQSYTFTTGTIYDLAKPPVLATRGGIISEVKDFRTDLNPKGIGYDQFEGSKNEIDKWLKKVSQPETDLSFLPTITGYSLGGALTQWVAASHQGNLGKIVTFNAPGISQQPGINLLATNNLGVTHYITSGDLLSMAGSTYLNGVWNLDKYSKLTSAITFEKHAVPVLNQSVTITDKIYTKPTDLTRKVSNGNTNDLSICHKLSFSASCQERFWGYLKEKLVSSSLLLWERRNYQLYIRFS